MLIDRVATGPMDGVVDLIVLGHLADHRYKNVFRRYKVQIWFERGSELCVLGLGLERGEGIKSVDIALLEVKGNGGGVKYGVFTQKR